MDNISGLGFFKKARKKGLILFFLWCGIILLFIYPGDILPWEYMMILILGTLLLANTIFVWGIVGRQIAEDYRKKEAHFRELWENAPVAYHLIDTNGVIKDVNKTELKMLGYQKDEMVGKQIFDFVLPEQKNKARERFKKKIKGISIPQEPDRQYIKKDGRPIYVIIDDVFEYDEQGNISGVRTTMADVTDTRVLEIEKQQIQEKLHQAEKLSSLGQFVANIMHELNNSLNGVMGFSKIASGLKPEGEMKNYIEKIYIHAVHSANIVKDLLKFSRADKVEFKKIDVKEVILSSLELYEIEMSNKNIEKILDIQPQVPEVSGDFYQLQEVFVNIILNAIQAIEELSQSEQVTEQKIKGNLRVKLWYDERKNTVYASFSDNGCGISEENIQKVFEPFFTTKKTKGTGLGLAVSYGIVQNHNGSISVTSRTGEGSTFIIELPIMH